jgi:ribose transport system ATP-binding protein
MRGICKRFPGVKALDAVDFDLRRGEVHVLLGENGAGKSTLMRVLSGACVRDSGEILFDGQSVPLRSPREAQARGISTIYQELNLVPHLSAAANIFLGREPSRIGVIDRARLMRDAAALLASLGTRIDPDARVSELSVAEQQMVEVAKALSLDARVLIMDEPTSALTESEIDQLFSAIAGLTVRGVSVIYISHRLEELARVGHRATVMRDGRQVATLPLPAPIAELVRLMVDRDVADHFPVRTGARGAELLRVERVSRGARLRDVSLTLHRGEILGVAGLLGARRTELARVIAGADAPDTGRVLLNGRPLRRGSTGDAIRAGVGLVPEDRKRHGLILTQSVAANLSLPQLPRLCRNGVIEPLRERQLVSRWIADLRIKTSSPDAKVMTLSGGNQQKVVLGKWLMTKPKVLMLDEPTRGVDVGAKRQIHELLIGLARDGLAVLLISSEIEEVLGLAHRVLVMRAGRIVGEFEGDAATDEAVMTAAFTAGPDLAA